MSQVKLARPITMADVAKAAGVSVATVSRVLNGHTRVDPDLAARVSEAAAAVDYVPNGVGRALRRQQSDLWAAIIPDVRNDFFISVVEAFESVANAGGFSVVLCNTHEDLARERSYIDTAIAQKMAGVLIAAASATKSRLGALQANGIPVVSIDRRVEGFAGDTVAVDNFMVGRLAAQHLIEVGSRRPVVLSGPPAVSSIGDRERSFRAAMEDAGYSMESDQVIRADLFSSATPHDVASRLLKGGYDAVFATNGPLTSGAFLGIREAGLSMPDQVALVGVDDSHWNRMVTPNVTVVAQPVDQIGRWAGRMLNARSTGEELDNARILLDAHLIVRGSSQR